MDAGTLTVKKARRGVHHVTFSGGGPKEEQLRWVVRGEPAGTTVQALLDVLNALPETTRVHMVHQLKDCGVTLQFSTRFQAPAAVIVLEIATGVSRKCGENPEKARELAERFCKAASQAFHDKGTSLWEFAVSLGLIEQETTDAG